MRRRDAIRTAGALMGGALVTSTGLLACEQGRRRDVAGVLSTADQDLIEEIADTLLPSTAASPGAKAAGVGAAINLILSDCFKPEQHQRVVSGLAEFRVSCRARHGAEFAELSRRDREALLRDIDSEAQRLGESHYFGLLRELSLGAYFSSEIGRTKALRYVFSPGRWVGCVPLEPGQPAWG